jgi:hypothetical protein
MTQIIISVQTTCQALMQTGKCQEAVQKECHQQKAETIKNNVESYTNVLNQKNRSKYKHQSKKPTNQQTSWKTLRFSKTKCCKACFKSTIRAKVSSVNSTKWKGLSDDQTFQ